MLRRTCLTLLAITVAACADPRYCDESTKCTDPAYPVCNLAWHECEPAGTVGDGGVADAPRDGLVAPTDGGCPSGTYPVGAACAACNTLDHCGASCEACPTVDNGDRVCQNGETCGYTCSAGFYDTGAACAACDVADHCGPSCLVCGGTTPECNGTRCVCDASSCSGTTPICDATAGACRACVTHGECPSGACDLGTGACVPASDIVYVNQNQACPGLGTQASPYCDFPAALASISAGSSRYRIVVRPGTYSFTSGQIVESRKVVIIGSGAANTTLSEFGVGPSVLQVSGTGDLSIYDITIANATTPQGHGISCTGNGTNTRFSATDAVITLNGGMGINASQCIVMLVRVQVTANTNGGIRLDQCSYTVVNSLISGNGTTGAATFGGVYVATPGSTATFMNNTVADNKASGTNAGGVRCIDPATVVNSILWGNANAQQSNCTVTYSDVQGGATGTGNINSDPLFTDPTNGDYHLKTTPPSPCINAGTAAGAPPDDLDGKLRSGAPDLGCYEAQ